MNFILLGLIILNKNTIIGGIFLLISHGIVSSALFICIGFLYERYHTRVLLYYKGICIVMPLYTLFFFIFILANASLPGTSNFVGEFLVILGIFEFNKFLVFFLLLGLFYSALINF
jgi:NADH-quinone oxidoreductase subunit M